jgi:hypothetical protein
VAAADRRRHLVSVPRAWSEEDALAQRLKGQFLDRRKPAGSLLAVCAAMGGAQAQVGSAARLSLAARVAGLTDARLRQAVEVERTLVKTWTVRGTLHFVPATDLPMHVASACAFRRGMALQWLARSGLSEKTLDALTGDILEALKDGPQNRRQIAERVGDAHGKRAREMLEHSWGGVFHTVTNLGLVCFGPAVDGQTTFVRIDQWLGAPLKPMSTEVAEAELARRFVLAYGPAKLQDFAYWAGLYAPVAKRMWDRIEDELRPVSLGGKTAYVHESVKGRPTPPASPHVRLLPNFDAYLLGHKGKDATIEPKRYKQVFKTAGWIAPVVLVDGRVRGTWALERASERLVARVAAFRTLGAAERAGVAAEAAELGRFTGLPARVRYGKPARPKQKVAWTGP